MSTPTTPIDPNKESHSSVAPPTVDGKTFIIDEVEYSFSITELENKDGLSIKFFETKPQKNISFSYEASSTQIIKDLQFLFLCKNLGHMIELLYDIFNKGQAKIEKQEEKYILELEFINKYKIELEKHEPIVEQMENDIFYKLKKLEEKYNELSHEIKNIKKNSSIGETLNIQGINNIDKNEIMKEIKEKIDIDIKQKIKELLYNEEIKNILFKILDEKLTTKINPSLNIKENENINMSEYKKIINYNKKFAFKKIFAVLRKYSTKDLFNLYKKKCSNKKENENKESDKKSIIKDKKENIEVDLEKNILEKVKKDINKLISEKLMNKNEENKFKENLNKIEDKIKNINEEINKIKNVQNNNKNDIVQKVNEYILPKINKNIEDNELVKKMASDINALNKKNPNNYIILKVSIDKDSIGNNIRILKQESTYKKYNRNFEPDDLEIYINKESVSIKYSNTNDSYSNSQEYIYEFYWNFQKEGLYTIKIIFKKKLTSCSNLFYDCNKITEIDLSNFDCSQVKTCYNMFYDCTSLKKIDFGNLDFPLVTSLEYMFYNCNNLLELNLSNFKTKYITSLKYLCNYCNKLYQNLIHQIAQILVICFIIVKILKKLIC